MTKLIDECLRAVIRLLQRSLCEGRISEEGMRVGRAEQSTRFGTESATRYKDDREREFYKGFFIRGTRFLGRGRSLHGLTKR